MFDYVVTDRSSNEPSRPRYMTTGVSFLVHGLVVAAAVGLPILYASEALPEPPSMMAFVVSAPPPPPPPPPPAPPEPEKKAPAKPERPNPNPTPPPPERVVAAPVEAPKTVAPETGLEAAPTKRAEIEAGFERGVSAGVEGGVVGGVESAAPPPPPPPPPPPAPQGPVRVGGQIKAPQLTHRVNPSYPPIAQSAMVEGSVVLEATVDKGGHVKNVRIVRGHPLLEAAAVAAVKEWTYEPLMLNGEATSFILTVTVTFSLPK